MSETTERALFAFGEESEVAFINVVYGSLVSASFLAE